MIAVLVIGTQLLGPAPSGPARRGSGSAEPRRRLPRRRRVGGSVPLRRDRDLHLMPWHLVVVPVGGWRDPRPALDDRRPDVMSQPATPPRPGPQDTSGCRRRSQSGFDARRVGRRAARSSRCTATEPSVDGATGLIGGHRLSHGGRHNRRPRILALPPTLGAAIELALAGSYDRAWFEESLRPANSQPEDAVDVAPSTSPSPDRPTAMNARSSD